MNTLREIPYPAEFQAEVVALRQLAQQSQMQPALIPKFIESAQRLLSRLSENEYLEFRAQLQGNMAFAYLNLPTGSRRQNLKKAISLASASVRVFRKDNDPCRYVRGHLVLGNCCIQLSLIGETSRLTDAIFSFEQVLAMKQGFADPVMVADALNGLGTAWQNLREGDAKENIGKALQCHQEVIDMALPDSHPFPQMAQILKFQKALAHFYLGEVCRDLYAAGHPERLAEGARHLEKALRFFSPEQFPLQHANAHLSLGTILAYLEEGSIGDNILAAIGHLENALQFFKEESFPFEYGIGHLWLGKTHLRLEEFQLGKPGGKEKVFRSYNKALKIYPAEVHPIMNATLQRELAEAYLYFFPAQQKYIEQAIHHYLKAGEVITRNISPVQYGKNKIFLANAYVKLSERTISSAPLVKALECTAAAMSIFDEEHFPVEYANGLLVQGNIHLMQWTLTGDDEQLEKAIQTWKLALPSTIQALGNTDKAMLYNLLGRAYQLLALKSDKPGYYQNVENSIFHFEQSLSYANQVQGHHIRFTVMRNLGVSLTSLSSVKGETRFIHRAEKLIDEALEAVDKEKVPQAYINLLQCKAFIILFDYAISNKDYWSGYEKIILVLEEALRHCSADNNPETYVDILLELGYCYQIMPNTGQQKNESYYTRALNAFDPDTGLERQVRIYYEIGDFYLKEGFKNAKDLFTYEYIERVHDLFEKGLEVDIDAKYYKALIHHRLSTIYAARATFEKGELAKKNLLKKSILHLEEAIDLLPATYHNRRLSNTLRTDAGNIYFEISKLFPQEEGHYQNLAIKNLKASIPEGTDDLSNEINYVFYDLATVYFFSKNWNEAQVYYEKAIESGQMIYQDAPTKAVKSTLLQFSSLSDAFLNNAICLAHMGQYEKAVELLENGRTRMVRDSLSINNALLQKAKPEDRQAFENAQASIRAIEAEMSNWERQYPSVQAQTSRAIFENRLVQGQEEWKTISEKIQSYLPEFSARPLDFSSIASIAEKDQPLVYISTRLHGTLAAIVPGGIENLSEDHVVWLDDFSVNELLEMVYGLSIHESYSGLTVGEEKGFIHAQRHTAAFMHKLESSLPVIEEQLMSPIKERLLELGFQKAMLVPDGFLSLLPLHALMPEIEVGFVPSAYYLKMCRDAFAEKERSTGRYLGIGNPASGRAAALPFAKVEVEVCSAFFPGEDSTGIFGRNAGLYEIMSKIPAATHIHFACHGKYEPEDPQESALFLAGADRLVVRQLLTEDIFKPNARLTILSACQTGIVDQEMAYEMAGFPATFIQAGVPGIISTLWPVDDLSTTLLMKRFFHCHIRKGQPPAAALAGAQAWLREGTVASLGLLPLIEAQMATAGSREKPGLYRARRYYSNRIEEKPFLHPYYWAGFFFTGV